MEGFRGDGGKALWPKLFDQMGLELLQAIVEGGVDRILVAGGGDDGVAGKGDGLEMSPIKMKLGRSLQVSHLGPIGFR